MEIKQALIGQYRAGLEMLKDCVEACPDDVYAAGRHPRTFWRIAYHALFYTHLYLMQKEEDFVPWERHQAQATILWDDDERGVPPEEVTFTREDIVEYQKFLFDQVESMVNRLDLDSPSSGFSWYKKPNKLEHQMINVRHLGVHVGQLQELLYAKNIELRWVSMA